MGKWRKILLAIDDVAPDRRVLQISLNLCRGIRARLNILQVVPGTPPVSPSSAPEGLETSGIESTGPPGENGYWFPESGYGGVLNSVLVKPGDPKQEISKYIETHGEVVIAVDDTIAGQGKTTEEPAGKHAPFKCRPITIPVVIIRKNRSNIINQQLNWEDNYMNRLFGGFRKKRSARAGTGGAMENIVSESPIDAPAIKADHPARLVVLGRESGFSPKIMGYALEMAQRMNYEIVALSTTPLTGTALALQPERKDVVCNDFKCVSRKNAELFKAEAEKRNIPFLHKVKFVNTDAALEEVNMELGEIGFIVSEPEKSRGKDAAGRDRRDPGILVYSLH